MTPFEIYLLVVSIIVIVGLASFFSILIWYIYVLTMRLIYVGYWDQELVQEYDRKGMPMPKQQSTLGKVISTAICGVLAVVVMFSVFLGISETSIAGSLPSLKVIKSDSMSYKYEDNKYLENNDLDDQIQMFDIIVSHAVPKEDDIQLYDVILYELDGDLIIHRVVFIEEANENHPEGRRFYTRGDAVRTNDPLPVKYEQIKGIYHDERIPFVGSFVLFMQSPAGFICLLLAIACMIIMPIVDDKIAEARSHRYRRLHTGFATIRRFYRKY